MTRDGNQPRNIAQHKESICLLQHIVSARSHFQIGVWVSLVWLGQLAGQCARFLHPRINLEHRPIRTEELVASLTEHFTGF